MREVRGDFGGGDCVSLLDPDGVEFGRGLVNYPAADVLKVAGRRSTEIPALLGYKVADEIIHRDNFVLMKRSRSVHFIECETRGGFHASFGRGDSRTHILGVRFI